MPCTELDRLDIVARTGRAAMGMDVLARYALVCTMPIQSQSPLVDPVSQRNTTALMLSPDPRFYAGSRASAK